MEFDEPLPIVNHKYACIGLLLRFWNAEITDRGFLFHFCKDVLTVYIQA